MLSKFVLCLSLTLTPGVAKAADPVDGSFSTVPADAGSYRTIKGVATPIDGRTLWFPTHGKSVQLDGVDSCDVPQWAFDPKKPRNVSTFALAPVPCGAMAKAWLKRAIGSQTVLCDISRSFGATLVGRCSAGSRDLGLEILRVGWARLVPGFSRIDYLNVERNAIVARYGIWGTYVLDMKEWRANAVDRTLDRRPIADINLLKARKAEITPPFADARRPPARTDR
jgi:endonuclease YncB( thermonuclease family)